MGGPGAPTGLGQELLRRKPVEPPQEHADGLKRSIGTFQLTMFGVGATVGTGIFFVLSAGGAGGGPRGRARVHHGGRRRGSRRDLLRGDGVVRPGLGLHLLLRLRDARRDRRDGGAACLLLEYGVSTAAVAVGWSGYFNECSTTSSASSCRTRVLAAPWDDNPGVINLPAVVLVALCALLLIRGASESARVNTVMVVIKLAVLAMFIVIAFTAFDGDRFADFAPFGFAGVATAAGTIFFSFIGLDAVSTAGEEVKDPQRAMPRALIAALLIVVTFYVLVAVAAVGTQPWPEFESQEAGLARILETVTGNTVWGTVLAAGAVVSIFSVTLVTLYGQTRILFAMGRDGMLPKMFARVSPRTQTPVQNTIVVAIVVALLAALVPLDYLIDVVSIGTLTAFVVARSA